MLAVHRSFPLPALDFATAGRTVTLNSPTWANGLTKMSFGCVAMVTGTPGNGNGIFAKRLLSNDDFWFDTTDATGNVILTLKYATTNLSYITTSSPLLLNNKWHFVAFNCDDSRASGDRIHIYTSNGLVSPLATATTTKTEFSGARTAGTAVTRLGHDLVNNASFPGRIALAFFSPNTYLDITELSAWQTNPYLLPRGCQGFWFGDDIATVVKDLSGYSNEGTPASVIFGPGVALRPRNRPLLLNALAAAGLGPEFPGLRAQRDSAVYRM